MSIETDDKIITPAEDDGVIYRALPFCVGAFRGDLCGVGPSREAALADLLLREREAAPC